MRFEVLDHRAEIFRLVRRRGGQGVADFAGLGLRHHRPVGQALVIVGEPIDELMAIAAEVFGRHERPYDVRGEIMRRSFCTRAGGMATSAP